MATIRKRGNSYQIRVSCGYDTSGNQVVQTMTWKPADGMNKKQIEKELQKQATVMCSINLRREQVKRLLRYSTSTSPTRTKDSPKLYKGQVKDRSRISVKKELRNGDLTSFLSLMCW